MKKRFNLIFLFLAVFSLISILYSLLDCECELIKNNYTLGSETVRQKQADIDSVLVYHSSFI